MQVQLKGGKTLEREQEAPRGSEANFASDADIVAKFERLAGHALPAKRVGELRTTVLGLEMLDDAAGLSDLLAAKAS